MLKNIFFALMAYLPFSIHATPINKIIGDESFTATHHRMPYEKDDEQLRIATHLQYAGQLLQKESTSHLNATQLENRKHILLLLSQYAKAGKFPANRKFTKERKPCFIDEVNGNICAVGYLIAETKGIEMAQEINKQYQYAFIEEMKLPELHAWANEYGLSLKECAIIQPTYDFDYRIDPELIEDKWARIAEEKRMAEIKSKTLEKLCAVLEDKDIKVIIKRLNIINEDSIYYYHVQQLYFSQKMYYVRQCLIRYFVKDSTYKYLKNNIGEVNSKKFPADYELLGNYGFAFDLSTKLTDTYDIAMYGHLDCLFMRLFDSDKHWYFRMEEYDIMQKISEMPKGYTVFIDYDAKKTFSKPE